ncbi:Transmembrane protein 41 [Mycena sanguinolenta]|uniref:Transmembrane protein 41 n=1 Tax=Mycena sanguinolenta TaxID=230812 RepID=A0A8H6Y8V4_9AGAR|nr:Transmembrane protein 41 [Mycena sanguinolenta]
MSPSSRTQNAPKKPLSVFTRRVVPTGPEAPPHSPMYLVASRILEWTHLSSPSRPDIHPHPDLVLPLASLPSQAHNEKKQPSQSPRFPSAHVPMLFVMFLLPLSTAFVFFTLTTLPITVSWPHTITDLAQLGRELHGYAQSGPAEMTHVIAVMSITAVWKHAWSIPGSVVWNVLGGALFSPAFATILLTTLTTIGSICATLLAMPLGPLITRFFPKALDLTRHVLEGDSDAPPAEGEGAQPRSSAWVRLSVMRLVGVVPWSGINIACGVCGVSMYDCMLGCFIGVLPWTAVTCQIGDILQTVASHPSPTPQTVSSLLTSPAIIAKLVLLSVLSLAPILGRDYLRAVISHGIETPPVGVAYGADASETTEKRASRWSVAWVHDWRTKIRIASRSRTRSREASQHQLDALVDEKRAIEDLPS